MKKLFLSVCVLVVITFNYLQARTFETFCGADNNFVAMMDLEIEQGLLVWKDKTNVGIVPIRIGWGVMNNMEVGVKLPYIFIQNNDNDFGDLAIYQKFKFIEESKTSPALSGGFELDLPTGNVAEDRGNYSEYTSKKLDLKLFLSAGKDLAKVRVFSSLGANFINGGDESALEYTGGVNLILSKVFKLIGEVSGKKYSSNDYGWRSQGCAVPGFIYSPNEQINIKFSMPIGLNNRSYDYGVNIGINHSF